jgi:hypothetical protein
MIAYIPAQNVSEVNQSRLHGSGLLWANVRKQSTAKNGNLVVEIIPCLVKKDKFPNRKVVLPESCCISDKLRHPLPGKIPRSMIGLMIPEQEEDNFVTEKLSDQELNQLVVCDVADVS